MATAIKIQNPNTVLGNVTDSNGRSLANLKVEVYDVDMREWQSLADTLTNKEGKYKLHWTHEQLKGRGKKTADIAVRVFTKEKNTELFKSSIDEVRFNASEREEINITIMKTLPVELVEFDFLVKEVSFLSGKVAIADLQENKEHRDVAFLSKELEVPAEKIEHLVVAHRLYNLFKIDAAFFYALLRKNTLLHNDFTKNLNARLSIGLGVDDQSLLYDAALTDNKKIETDIKTAVEEMLVAHKEIKNVKRNLEILSQYRKKAEEYYKNEHPQKVINLLTNFFKEGKLQEIQELFKNHKYDLNGFFEKITDPSFYAGKEKEKVAKTNIELGKLFGFGNEVIPKIAKSKGIKKPEDLRKLAKLNKTEWVSEISKARPDIKDMQLIRTYASAMVRKMEKEFPTLAFAAQLERAKKPVLKNQDKIISFFKNHEDFDLMKHNVDLYLKEKKVATIDREAINEELKSVQRVFKLVPNYRKTMALRNEKIHSSQSIVAIGETRFIKEVAPKAGIDEIEAKEIYRTAETRHTAAMLMVGDLQDSMSVMDIASFETTTLAKKLEAVSKDFPNLKSLFKLVDSCECEHCRSVYSPAAYLVEILQFLDKRAAFSIPKKFIFNGNLTQGLNPQTGLISNELRAAIVNEGFTISATTRITNSESSLTRFEIRDSGQLFIIDKIGENNYSFFKYEFSDAKGQLFLRRPELGEIDLGCANANTPVKYIDLVCEILEEAVAPDAGITYTGDLSEGADPLKGRIYNDLMTTLNTNGFKVTPDALIFETESSTTKPHYLRDKGLVCKIDNTGGNNYIVYRLRQTFGTAAELDAAPEYVNNFAYRELRNKAYAFKLPFDLHHTEAKAYLSRFNVNRVDLMKAFQSASIPSDENIAAESLGLTDAERTIIVNSPAPNDNTAQQAYWNVPAPWNVLDYLKQVDHFLDRTGLSYTELELILKLKFIDTNGNLFIKHNDLSCDTQQKGIANLDLDALDRIHRFLRLQKKTGWKFEVLDEIISQRNLGAENLDDACLIKAAQLKEISEKANIKIEELIGCFGEIPHLILQEDGLKPLYNQVFLNKARNGIVDDRLSVENILDNEDGILNPASKPVGWVPATIVDVIDIVPTCLQLKQNDLEFIIPILPDGNLTFSNLSRLFATSRLLKKFNLKAKDYAIIQNLSGIDFPLSPATALEFIEVIEDFKISPLKAPDVRFILNHDATNLNERQIKVDKIEELLGNLKTGYEKINDEQKSKFDNTLSAEEQKETLQNELSKLSGITEEDTKSFVRFIDNDLNLLQKAKSIINTRLNSIYTSANIATLINKVDALEAVTGPDYRAEKNELITSFCLIIDSTIDVSSLSDTQKIDALKDLLNGISVITKAEVDSIISYIEIGNKKRFVDDKLNSLFNATAIKAAIVELDNRAATKEQDINNYEDALLALKAANEQLRIANIALSNATNPAETNAANELIASANSQITIANAELNTTTPPYVISSGKNLLQAFLDTIAEYNIKESKQEYLKQTVAVGFKVDLALVAIVLKYSKLKQHAPGTDLISDLLSDNFDNSITPLNYAKHYAAIKLLHKIVYLLNAFKLTNQDVEWYLKNNADPALGWFEIDGIPYDGGHTAIAFSKYLEFLKIVHYSNQFTAVINPLDAEKPISFFSVAEMVLLGIADEFLNKLALLTGYENTDLNAIDAHLFTAFDVANYKDINNWKRLFDCTGFGRKLGANVTQIKKYINPILTESDVSDLRATLKSRYDEDTWLSTLKEIMDAIRPQKRNALVAYLLATNPEMKNENDLYEYFLVDLEMEACMPSSRIVLAHNSIQLFVQRCLMGLEPDAIADVEKDPNWNQWKWMKNYRVWEANRKVFLYPENWYDVTLTDDKTYLLTEFINEIQQNELTNDSAEDALKKYLEKLDNIAFLEVMATWYDVPTRNMHVFARTKGGDPSIYYYRRFEYERYWSPWEKVELDITGDHLLAFMRNNRLHLAWPMFSEEANPEQESTIPPATAGVVINDKPKKKLKIQLAISEYTNKKWQPKRVSKDAIKTPPAINDYTTDLIPKEYIKFFYNQWLDQIIVFIEQITFFNQGEIFFYQNKTVIPGAFDIAGCKGYPELASPGPFTLDFVPKFRNTSLIQQRYKEKNSISVNDLSVINVHSILSGLNFIEILNQTPGTFRITYPHQSTSIDLIALFYQLFHLTTHYAKTNDKVKQYKFPLGTLLPYFKEDSNHAYVIIPGFYKKVMDPGEFGNTYTLNDSEKRTASNVFQLLDDITIWFKKISFEFQENPPADTQAAVQIILTDSDFQEILKELSKYADLDMFLNMLIGVSGDPNVDEFLKELINDEPLKYGEQFKNMYHPLVCALRSILYKDGISGLMKRDTQLQKASFDFKSHYSPNPHIVPQTFNKNPDGTLTLSYPIEDIDFNSDGSYSAYNWDLFYRVPLHIAASLTKNQRFEEALTWFHYMFNPTGALPGIGVQKYWVTKPFYLNQNADYISQRIDSLMYATANLSNPNIKELEFAVSEWRNKPFRPDVIARFRPVAYQKALLMKYIDNLTEWGDYLFRQDTMESIAQATQMYILADKLLGPKPRIIPAAVKQPYETYNQLEAKLDSFGNALTELENILPDLSVLPEGGNELPASHVTLAMLYFCIPANEKMFEYWDRVADRLFKIRHCQNIDGVERSLALFAPPIDPGMLVRAAASGLDLSSIIAGLNAPIPYYRFNVLSLKATELAQEVRGLGNSLLQAMEKKDAEALSLLRSELELKVLIAVKDIKKLQINEAKEQIEVLKRTKKVTEERQKYYSEIEYMNALEITSLTLNGISAVAFTIGSIMELTAGATALIPDTTTGASGFGGSPVATFHTFGGEKISSSTSSFAKAIILGSQVIDRVAGGISTVANYQRRFDDWKLQERLATKELASLDKQIVAAEIRKEIAETDLNNHELQIDNAKKTDDFMRSKFTNMELYDWMIGQISSVYFRSYQLAHDFAKKAERCYRFELGNDDTYISYGYWDSMKKGLQSADHLIHDIKRMETGYLDKNKREYEMTKQVSLAQLDPLALVMLRASGICHFGITEEHYDIDNPGHYFRRLESCSISIPCIVGPHPTVSAKLSLVNNRYRKNTNPDNSAGTGYVEDPGNDERFIYNIGAIQSIATSHAQNDSGVFEVNFRDERYLPFENTGAISSWRLELPTEIRQFDYNTISDVIIHIKYTAREGGSVLKNAANNVLKSQLQVIRQSLDETGLHIALNMKHDLPNEWHLLKKNGTIDLTLDKSRLPYMVQAIDSAEIDSVMFLAKVLDNPPAFTINVDGPPTHLSRVDELKLCKGINEDIGLGTLFTLSVSDADKLKLEDLLLIVKYKF